MERVIAKHIYAHLAENNLLSQAQHGFVSGHSTCTNLLECLNDWTLTVQRKKAVTVAYIDFSRAFDSVSHNKLLAKLHSMVFVAKSCCGLSISLRYVHIKPEWVIVYQMRPL